MHGRTSPACDGKILLGGSAVNRSTAARRTTPHCAATGVTQRDAHRSKETVAMSHRPRFSRIAVFASAAMLLISGAAPAQPVAVFDDAPTIEQLRSIMIPESRPGASRSIVLQMPEAVTAPAAVQQASTDVAPAPRRRSRPRSAQMVKAEAAMPAPQPIAFHVNFAFNSAVLPDSAHEMIDLIVQLMKETTSIKVRVEGHTDATGAAAYNVFLSEKRALSVGEYLVQQGIDPSRLEVVGKGMAEPLTANRYDPANRRVQFARID
jgi:outer membrane protein OmpA-like peptidoglycan-associated protein